MDSESLGIMLAGISSILGVLIYFTKNVRESSCCGSKCKQVVVDGHGDVVKTGSMCRDLEIPPFDQNALAARPPTPYSIEV